MIRGRSLLSAFFLIPCFEPCRSRKGEGIRGRIFLSRCFHVPIPRAATRLPGPSGDSFFVSGRLGIGPATVKALVGFLMLRVF